jgi:hypothetical protein
MKCTPLIAFFFQWWLASMVVTFHYALVVNGGDMVTSSLCLIIPQIHSGLFLPLNLVSNGFWGANRA